MNGTTAPIPPVAFHAWTPATDTREIPTLRRGAPLGDQPTEVLHLTDLTVAMHPVLDLPPAVEPTRHSAARRALGWVRDVAVVLAIALPASGLGIAILDLTGVAR